MGGWPHGSCIPAQMGRGPSCKAGIAIRGQASRMLASASAAWAASSAFLECSSFCKGRGADIRRPEADKL